MTWIQALIKGGYNWRGQMRYLLGREADPSLCQVSGFDSATVERALDAICGAFSIPLKQRYCLRPEDSLLEMYKSITWLADRMEFEILFLDLEQICGREIDLQEIKRIGTVGDVITFIASKSSNSSTQS
jgi:hypothetical protein